MSGSSRNWVIAFLCTLLLLTPRLSSHAAFPPESDIPQLDTTFPGMGVLPVADDYTTRPQLLLAAENNTLFSTINTILTRRLPDGTPDPAFGANGSVTLKVNNVPFQPQSIVRDSEGRLVLGGILTSSGSSNKPQAIIRLVASGTLDPEFGSGGVIWLSYMSVGDGLPQVAVQADDRVVVLAGDKAGITHPLLRFTNDGLPDDTFGQNGVVVLSEDDRYLTLQAAGIVIAGVDSSGIPKTVLRRYAIQDGAPDLTFGKDGVRFIALGNTSSTYPTHLTHDMGDRLWLSLATNDEHQAATLYTARLTAQGTLDPTYNEDGVATMVLPKGIAVSDLIAPSDNTLVGVGADSVHETVLFRFTQDGTPDPAFGTEGVWLDGVDGFALPQSLIRRTDGSYFIAGFHAHPSLQKYTAGGVPDPAFGVQGFVALRADSMTASSRWLQRPDGGKVAYLSGARFLVFRPNNTIDTSVGTNGLVSTFVNNTRNSDGHLDAQGRFYLIGYEDPTTAPDETAAITRLTPSGELDDTFGRNGTLLIGTRDVSRALIGGMDAQGRLLAVGTDTNDGFSRQTVLYRVLQSGDLDPTFGEGGKVILDVEAYSALHLRTYPDGSIVVGASSEGDKDIPVRLYRRLPDGSPDLTFGEEGVVTIDRVSRLNDLVLQPDGRVVALGFYRDSNNRTTWQLVRTTETGAFDSTFGVAGRVALSPPGSASGTDVYALTVHPGGRMLVIGRVQTGTRERAWVAQLLPDGSLDTALNDTGYADITLGESGAYYAITLDGDRALLVGNMEFNPYNVDNQIVTTRFVMGDLDAPVPAPLQKVYMPLVVNTPQ